MTLRKRLSVRLIKDSIRLLQADWRASPNFDLQRLISKLIEIKNELEGSGK